MHDSCRKVLLPGFCNWSLDHLLLSLLVIFPVAILTCLAVYQLIKLAIRQRKKELPKAVYASQPDASSDMPDDTLELKLPTITISPGQTTTITSDRVSPRGPIYPVGLSIDPSEDINWLIINHIKIGTNSQFYTVNGVPASLFERSTCPISLLMSPMKPGMQVSLALANSGLKMIKVSISLLARRRPPKNSNELMVIMSFGTTKVAPCCSAHVIASPQMSMMAYSLYVTPDVADHFDVCSLSAEKYLDDDSQYVVSADHFSHDTLVRGPVVLPPGLSLHASTRVDLAVRNRTTLPLEFTAVLLGQIPSSSRDRS